MSTEAPPLPAPTEATTPVRSSQPVPIALRLSLAMTLTFTVLMVFLTTYAFGLSALQEQRSQHQLYAQFRGLLSSASPVAPPIGGAIPAGTPVALISAPVAGINRSTVVEGTSSADLLRGPGHLRDSALPGQHGQSVLIGKSVTAGAPFRHIDRLAVGDSLSVRTAQGLFEYEVIDRRDAAAQPPEIPVGGAILTLVTSIGSGWLGSLAPSHLLYVDAKLMGQAVNAPAGRPIAVPDAELPGNNDPAAWPFLVLWLQALLVAAAAAAWAWSRWGRRQTWLVGTPLLLAVLWAVADASMRLLPNVL